MVKRKKNRKKGEFSWPLASERIAAMLKETGFIDKYGFSKKDYEEFKEEHEIKNRTKLTIRKMMLGTYKEEQPDELGYKHDDYIRIKRARNLPFKMKVKTVKKILLEERNLTKS